MRAKILNLFVFFAVAGILFWITVFDEPESGATVEIAPEALAPDWSAFADWPGLDADTAASEPDPNRATAILVFDDSGSMENVLEGAKVATLDFAGRLPRGTYLGALGLNSGILVDPMPVEDAVDLLSARLAGVVADGGTPLGAAIRAAHEMLRAEAAGQRGFGTYQILVTTDGQADDDRRLLAAVSEVLTTSPVRISTIGLGIGEGHPLNLGAETDYVAIENVAELSGALEAVSAEQQTFDPITAFEDGN